MYLECVGEPEKPVSIFLIFKVRCERSQCNHPPRKRRGLVHPRGDGRHFVSGAAFREAGDRVCDRHMFERRSDEIISRHCPCGHGVQQGDVVLNHCRPQKLAMPVVYSHLHIRVRRYPMHCWDGIVVRFRKLDVLCGLRPSIENPFQYGLIMICTLQPELADFTARQAGRGRRHCIYTGESHFLACSPGTPMGPTIHACAPIMERRGFSVIPLASLRSPAAF